MPKTGTAYSPTARRGVVNLKTGLASGRKGEPVTEIRIRRQVKCWVSLTANGTTKQSHKRIGSINFNQRIAY